uniref:Uncharacterized protein n=1 Tax=Rhizophora mucronata TaxID=61149 RepID=A0A2P2NFM5_RHIMU
MLKTLSQMLPSILLCSDEKMVGTYYLVFV